MVFSLKHGQRIQSGAIFCDDGNGGVGRVRVTAFYTQRTAHGRTAQERAAYAIGEKAREEPPAGTKLPTDADLNMMAQKYFKQQGSGEQQSWDLAFENGYADGFKKTHRPSH